MTIENLKVNMQKICVKPHTINVIDTNETTKEIKVIISTEYGNFTGSARLHPEDIEYNSTIFGSDIAEARAVLKYYKLVKKLLSAELRGMYVLETRKCKSNKKVIIEKKENFLILCEEIVNLEKGIINSIKSKDKLNQKIKNKQN